jgi:hypothetical protein
MPTFVIVRATSTGNISLTGPIASPMDGVALGYNDYVLLKDQTNPVQNGITWPKSEARPQRHPPPEARQAFA